MSQKFDLLVRRQSSPDISPPYPPNNLIDVYVVGGQSNADGRVNGPCPVADGTGLMVGQQMFNDGITQNFSNWQFGVNSGAFSNVSTQWAFDAIALAQMETYVSRPIYVIKHTQGGTAMSPVAASNGNWAIPFDSSVTPSMAVGMQQKINITFDRLAAIGKVANFKGILWHQGESDYQNASTYHDLMVTWIATIRSWCRNSNLPFFFGTISLASSEYSSIVDAAQRQISVEVPNCYLVDNSNATLQIDGLHFDGPSSINFGGQVFTFMQQVIGKNQ